MLRQKDFEFEDSLAHIVRSCLKTKTTKTDNEGTGAVDGTPIVPCKRAVVGHSGHIWVNPKVRGTGVDVILGYQDTR
jgi:hypothetical protein